MLGARPGRELTLGIYMYSARPGGELRDGRGEAREVDALLDRHQLEVARLPGGAWGMGHGYGAWGMGHGVGSLGARVTGRVTGGVMGGR